MFNRSGKLSLLLVVAGALTILSIGIALAMLPPGGTFTDDNGNIHEGNIEAIAAEGITKGCNPPTNDKYCPGNSLTRGQMAAFIRRALNLPSSGTDYFTDDNDSVFEGDINAIAEAGITKGCNPPTSDKYCPDGKISRGQMAAFLRRAFDYPTVTEDYFIDDGESIFEGDINSIAAVGVTKGCNPPMNDKYCPESLVKRDQMASFFARALGLTPIIPPPPTTTPPPTTPPPTTPPPTTPPPTSSVSLSYNSGSETWSGTVGSESVTISYFSNVDSWSGSVGSDSVSLKYSSNVDSWSGWIGSDQISLSYSGNVDVWGGWIGSTDQVFIPFSSGSSGDSWGGSIGSDSVSLSRSGSANSVTGSGPRTLAAIIPIIAGPSPEGWDSYWCTYEQIPMWGDVYVTSSANFADVVVNEVFSSSLADLVVTPVSSGNFANSCGKWYFTTSSNFADFDVYFSSFSSPLYLDAYFTGSHP